MTKKIQRRKTDPAFLKLLVILIVLMIAGTYYFQRMSSIHVESGDQIQVIDVSRWNGKINWKKVKKSDIYYAMLRIGRGAQDSSGMAEDSYFYQNYQSGRSYNMKMGVYFYSHAETTKEAKKEAEYCLGLLEKYGIKPKDLAMPVAYDVEEESIFATGKNNVTKVTKTFCDAIEDAGYTPMVYSSASSLMQYFKHSTIKNYKIWVAHYGVEESGPSYPYHYDMWQYTSEGIVPGANTSKKDHVGNCDINYYIVE
ncbi:MAG TPA: glycoside hydrolase family 25 protein [Candidatus Fimousia stercorigallinarum]|nr:glycoside hydrolase family 25 protein [Candidatus Fimousia stercorigallinarum]